MRTVMAVWVAVFGLLAVSVVAGAQEAGVPVTKVTSFSSGVAYYEHNGKVTGNATVVLKFKQDQINDILKSLVLIDQAGGQFGVSYASKEPLARVLKSFGIDISGNPTLAQVLEQIRGAQVVVSTPDKIAGKVLSVEKKKKLIVPSNTIIEEDVVNIVTDAGIKAIPLATVGDITLANEQLNSELNKALALLIQSRDTERKPVEITFVGKGERGIRIGYINEAPIWRTSYRLVLSDKKAKEEKPKEGDKGGPKALMQGWAIVENTSDFDWDSVMLTLIAGRPISFIEDLYTPLYVPRPVVRPELYASLMPQKYEEGLEAEKKVKELAARRAPRASAGGAKAAMGDMAFAAEGAVEAPPSAPSGEEMGLAMGRLQPTATGGAVGELFSYTIKDPVTLPRQRSAMLPIINQDVAARKVSIYNASVLAGYPLNGFWLTNDTALSLLAGPVTVYDEGTYAGDAQVGNLSPGEKRLLSYAIDLKVKVDSSQKDTSAIVAGKINRGVLEVTRRYDFRQEYVLKNKAEKDKTVLIEHPRRGGWKLVKPAEPLEKTDALYRFEVDVPAGETGKFEVAEQRVETQTIAILPTDINTIVWYSQSGEISKKVREALVEAISRRNALSDVQRQLGELEQQVQVLRNEQAQVRANMQVVDRASQAYQRFEKKLLDLETKIEELQGQVKEKRVEMEKLRKALEGYVSGLSVE